MTLLVAVFGLLVLLDCLQRQLNRWVEWPNEDPTPAGSAHTHAASRKPDQPPARLREAAARDGLSMQAAARPAVEDYINRRTATRDALLAQILTEDAAVLKRLADP